MLWWQTVQLQSVFATSTHSNVCLAVSSLIPIITDHFSELRLFPKSYPRFNALFFSDTHFLPTHLDVPVSWCCFSSFYAACLQMMSLGSHPQPHHLAAKMSAPCYICQFTLWTDQPDISNIGDKEYDTLGSIKIQSGFIGYRPPTLQHCKTHCVNSNVCFCKLEHLIQQE